MRYEGLIGCGAAAAIHARARRRVCCLSAAYVSDAAAQTCHSITVADAQPAGVYSTRNASNGGSAANTHLHQALCKTSVVAATFLTRDVQTCALEVNRASRAVSVVHDWGRQG